MMQKQKILLMCNKGKRATSTLACVRSGKCVKHDLVSSTSGSLEKLGLLPADLRQSSPGESLPTAELAGSGPPAGDRPHVDRALESAGGDERGKSPGSPPLDGETADDDGRRRLSGRKWRDRRWRAASHRRWTLSPPSWTTTGRGSGIADLDPEKMREARHRPKGRTQNCQRRPRQPKRRKRREEGSTATWK